MSIGTRGYNFRRGSHIFFLKSQIIYIIIKHKTLLDVKMYFKAAIISECVSGTKIQLNRIQMKKVSSVLRILKTSQISGGKLNFYNDVVKIIM